MSLDGGQVYSLVPCSGVDAVSSILFAGVLWCCLGQELVDTFAAYL